MIHKQQVGHALPDIIAGLCQALVRNYLSNVGQGQGAPRRPSSSRAAWRRTSASAKPSARPWNCEIIVPEHFEVMGAIGAALLAAEAAPRYAESGFRGLVLVEEEVRTVGRECQGCPNLCEIVTLQARRPGGRVVGGQVREVERGGERSDQRLTGRGKNG